MGDLVDINKPAFRSQRLLSTVASYVNEHHTQATYSQYDHHMGYLAWAWEEDMKTGDYWVPIQSSPDYLQDLVLRLPDNNFVNPFRTQFLERYNETNTYLATCYILKFQPELEDVVSKATGVSTSDESAEKFEWTEKGRPPVGKVCSQGEMNAVYGCTCILYS